MKKDPDPRTALLKIHAPDGVHEALCTGILVPSPARVMLDALEVLTQAEVWIRVGKRFGVIEDREVVYRKLLVRSNTYKQTLLKHRRSLSKPHGIQKNSWTSPGHCHCPDTSGSLRSLTWMNGTLLTRYLRRSSPSSC